MELLPFGFAVELGALRNLDQILIVRGALDLGLRGVQLLMCGLHSCSSFVRCAACRLYEGHTG